MRIGQSELLIILLIVIVIFGPSQIPKLVRMFKKSSKSFKEGMAEEEDSSAKETKTSEE